MRSAWLLTALLACDRAPPVERVEIGARDLDRDGYPDAAELLGEGDRAAFVSWFVAIAESQARAIDDAWPKVHQDCAGLVRFAYKEALRTHDAAWLSKRRALLSFSAPDVSAFSYPEVPILGDRIFRSRGGAFDRATQVEDAFTAAANARALMAYGSALVSRDLADARPGDLLFFAVPHAPGSGLHTMIVLGERPGAPPSERASRVVYHTGGDEVRVVRFDELMRHPDPGWHPVAGNARFLGVHRLHILQHEVESFAARVQR